MSYFSSCSGSTPAESAAAANLRQVSTVGAPQGAGRAGAVGREAPEVHRAPVDEGRQTMLDDGGGLDGLAAGLVRGDGGAARPEPGARRRPRPWASSTCAQINQVACAVASMARRSRSRRARDALMFARLRRLLDGQRPRGERPRAPGQRDRHARVFVR